MSVDPAIRDHQGWLGYLQPDGLVVSPAALVDSQVLLPKSNIALQERFLGFVHQIEHKDGATVPAIKDFGEFVTGFLGWPADCLYGFNGTRPLPESLSISLSEFGETLSPNFAFQDPRPKEPDKAWLLLIQMLPLGTDLDARNTKDERGWSASASQRFERLMRETGVSIGLLSNGTQIRLIYRPPSETSGSLTFPIAAMTEVPGRPILAAFDLLLNRYRLLAAPNEARLPALLQRSRDYQSRVSSALARQVLDCLYELLRGFESANQHTKGDLLRDVLEHHSDDVYGGLLTVLLRLVFILFAEDRGLLPASSLYVRHYSVHGLFERLRNDRERYPDTMDHRYGAWAQLLALFRAIHDGCRHPQMKIPVRSGYLFDPERFRFLAGRSLADPRLPLVSDGTVFRVLEKLLVLEGERLSYRTLDVQEIGSVYQTIMGFALEVATGTSIALKGKSKSGGVPAASIVSLESLLAAKSSERPKWLKENADTELTGEADKRLKAATTVGDLLVALEKRVDRHATPAPVAKGGLVLQPTDERRRSGSHYTPRSFTEPIVRKTLEPILKRFGEHPTPAQILELKICDIAVGSAAFLVETCRQLADVLVKAWRTHGGPQLPPDETEELLAMRTIAQRCLCGVDRNPMAVDLAKLSLWLATLAKDHPFTFLDHAIRCGDSLVGLTRRQIETFTWETKFTTGQLWEQEVRKRTAAALRERQDLLGLEDDYGSPELKREKLEKADELLDLVRFIGDAAVAAFFAADKDKAREAKRAELAQRITDYLGKGDLKQRPTDEVKALRGGKFPVTPFHWEIEFPEVFDRENAGFDAIIGNQPFLGGKRITTVNGEGFRDWLAQLHDGANSNTDLVAHFFRRSFSLVRPNGCLGLIATNTIGQGDTRSGGLRWVCTNGGTIYAARKRYKWPGQAAVTVSILNIIKGEPRGPFELDGEPVPLITAYLFHDGGHENPTVLKSNAGKSFIGSYVLGMGFTFDDTDKKGVANPISEMQRLIAANPRNGDLIFPYIGGEEINDSPTHSHHRYVMNFGEMSEDEARRWPDLMRIVETRVKPERILKPGSYSSQWWLYGRRNLRGQHAIAGLSRVLALSQTSKFLAVAFLPNGMVYSHKTVLFASQQHATFSVVQCSQHEIWMQFFGSSLEDRPVYTPTDCFETFPFPAGFETNAALEAAGREYYEFRAALMQDLWLGLTEIYNLFHSPDDEALARLEALYRKRAPTSDWRTAEAVPAGRSPLTLYATPTTALAAVRRLRELHAAMDTAVLSAYGWTDLLPKCTCEFLLDYEDDESESGAEESTGRKKKKPWRYRWPDEVRDEVLARLLKLNAERAEEEKIAGIAGKNNRIKKQKRLRNRPTEISAGDLGL